MGSSADENRAARRDKKQHKRRHGQRGGSGKHSTLIFRIIKERSDQIKQKKEKELMQPTQK